MSTYTQAFSGYGGMNFNLTLTSTESASDNTSTVTYTLFVKKIIADAAYQYSNGNSVSFTLNGTTISNTPSWGRIDIRGLALNGTVTLYTGKLNVAHKSDGTKSIAYSATFTQTQTGMTATLSGTHTLPTIARKSEITSVTSTVNVGSAPSIKWKPANSSYRYKIKYTCGSWSKTTDNYITPSTTSEYTYSGYSIPASIVSSVFGTSTKSKSATVTLYTYPASGSTALGSSDAKSFTIQVPNSGAYAPTISTVSVSDSTSYYGDFGFYLQNLSKAKITTTASSTYSTISKYEVTIKLGSSTSQSHSGSSNTWTSAVFGQAGTYTISVKVIDARGNYATKSASNLVISAYSRPTISASCFRCTSNGTEDEDGGKYAVITAKGKFSTLSGNTMALYYSLDNSTWTRFQAGASSGTTYNSSPIGGGSFSPESSYKIYVRANDHFTGAGDVVQLELPSAAIPMDFLSTGKGAAIGMVAKNTGYLDVAWRIRAHDGVVNELGESYMLSRHLRDGYSVANGKSLTITSDGTYRALIAIFGTYDAIATMRTTGTPTVYIKELASQTAGKYTYTKDNATRKGIITNNSGGTVIIQIIQLSGDSTCVVS